MKEIRLVTDKEYKKVLRGQIIASLISLGFIGYVVLNIISKW